MNNIESNYISSANKFIQKSMIWEWSEVTYYMALILKKYWRQDKTSLSKYLNSAKKNVEFCLWTTGTPEDLCWGNTPENAEKQLIRYKEAENILLSLT